MANIKPKVFKGTWSGRPGTSTLYPITTGPNGLRIIVHQWDDEVTATVRVIEGDFRYMESSRKHGVEYLNIVTDDPALVAGLQSALRAEYEAVR